MNFKFSSRMSRIDASTIREILKVTPNVISLAAGSPSKEAFPKERIAEIMQEIMEENPVLALQYNVSEGYTPLREKCKEIMREDLKNYDELIITTGAQQAIELFTKAMIDKNDVIICENPSFLGSLNGFKSFEANLESVEVKSDGISIESLEKKLETSENVKFIYVIPNFQNPTGTTMTLEKRKQVLELAKKYDTLILEDNPYGDLRFSGEDIPTIKSMDTEGRVVYVGSFSKTLSPGLRLGYLAGHKEIINKAVICKQSSDVHTPMITQLICDKFLSKYDYNEHISALKKLYKEKSELMISEMRKKFSKEIKFNAPEGGLFVWCTLPNQVNMMDFCKKALENNVAVVPGSAFLVDNKANCQSFRMNYSTPTREDIVKAVDILSKIELK